MRGKKIKKEPKVKSKSKVGFEGTIENKSFLMTRVDPLTISDPQPYPKNSPLGTQKFKNDPKIMSKSKVRIEENIENKSCSTT